MKDTSRNAILNERLIYDYIGIRGLKNFADSGGLEKLEDLPIILENVDGNSSVLELGSGTGRLSKDLIRTYEDFCGVEINRKYYKTLVEKFGASYFYKMDALEIESLNKKFDAVVAPWTFFWHFTEDVQKKLLDITFRILKKDGVCMVESFKVEDSKFFNMREGGALDSGYEDKVLRFYPLPNEKYKEIGEAAGFKSFDVREYELSKISQKRNWLILRK